MSDQISPSFIIFDPKGPLEQEFDATIKRLEVSGSWKRQRIVVIIPTGNLVPAKAALSWWNLAFPPNNGVVKYLAEGMEVGEAYSRAIENILAHPQLRDFEFILTIEHDNVPSNDAVLLLLEAMEKNPNLSAISGLYQTKGQQGVYQIWGDPRDPIINFRPQIPKPNELMECCGTGMGFCLWRMSMFKDERIEKPWFRTVAGKEGVGTQDLHFWGKVRPLGYRCAVDCRVRVGHIDIEGNFGPKGHIW